MNTRGKVKLVFPIIIFRKTGKKIFKMRKSLEKCEKKKPEATLPWRVQGKILFAINFVRIFVQVFVIQSVRLMG